MTIQNTEQNDFWEQPEQVTRFADREPDKRLMQILPTYEDPTGTRILDLGCAAGRNTVVLAEHGFDFYAVDASKAMIAKTRKRTADTISADEMQRRIQVACMDDLSELESDSFQLIIALGILHNAHNDQEWHNTISETKRLLRQDGKLLVSNFDPESNPSGRCVQPVKGEPHVYEGHSSGRLFLLSASDLDAYMERHGFESVTKTETVRVKTEMGERITVNALYRKIK